MSGYCYKCGAACEVIFRYSKKTEDGKVITSKSGRPFPITLNHKCK